MNNPLEFIKAIANPQQFVQSIMNNNNVMQNPIMSNAIKMYQNGDTDGLGKLVNNVAHERGTSVEEIAKKLGLQ